MSAPPELPDIVARAFDVSRKAGYVSFCRNETGRLLATLAATRGGTMAEFGTGCGVGTAWLRSGADWSLLHERGPYSLVFLDSGEPEAVRVDAVVDLLEPGGIVVLDDFTPCEMWPPITYGRVDTLREEWLTDERFTAVEVMIAPDASALIATRR
jgi:predicted O-methyltransferase YrrM